MAKKKEENNVPETQPAEEEACAVSELDKALAAAEDYKRMALGVTGIPVLHG